MSESALSQTFINPASIRRHAIRIAGCRRVPVNIQGFTYLLAFRLPHALIHRDFLADDGPCSRHIYNVRRSIAFSSVPFPGRESFRIRKKKLSPPDAAWVNGQVLRANGGII
jgi:hypothetical protein